MTDTSPYQRAQRALNQSNLNVKLSSWQIDGITTFLQLRQRWSKAHNLSGPKAHNDPWLMDVNDAVAMHTILRTTLPVIDVGSGSGVPGLILKILAPELPMILVEPLSKRAAFLKTVIHKLQLKDIQVERVRWPRNGAAPCQVVSRAVVTPDVWPQLADEGTHVQSIYRYLASNRPRFCAHGFNLAAAVDYQRNDDESLRLERWDRT